MPRALSLIKILSKAPPDGAKTRGGVAPSADLKPEQKTPPFHSGPKSGRKSACPGFFATMSMVLELLELVELLDPADLVDPVDLMARPGLVDLGGGVPPPPRAGPRSAPAGPIC